MYIYICVHKFIDMCILFCCKTEILTKVTIEMIQISRECICTYTVYVSVFHYVYACMYLKI
jgi:hypothetical protein